MPRVTGEVVDVKVRDWSMDGRSGTTVTLLVQESRASIVSVKLPATWPGHLTPQLDEPVDLLVDLRLSGASPQLVAREAYTGYTSPGGIDFPPAVVDRRAVAGPALASA